MDKTLYIPELPDKYNIINEKLEYVDLLEEGETRQELFKEFLDFLSEERNKMYEKFPEPIDQEAETYYGYPLETVTIAETDIVDFYIYEPERYTNNTLKAVKIGHLYIIDNTYRKEGCSYFDYNFGVDEIKELILSNKVNKIDPCLIKYGFHMDYYGSINIAPFFLEKFDESGKIFICNWS